MKSKLIILTILATTVFTGFTQDESDINYSKMYWLIGGSTKSFETAKKIANDISVKLDLPLNFRDLTYHSDKGVTFSKEKLKELEIIEYPLHLLRYNDIGVGDVVSVEWSNDFKGFKEGYYLVVISNKRNKDEKLLELLGKTKNFIKDAYIKSSIVYSGCSH